MARSFLHAKHHAVVIGIAGKCPDGYPTILWKWERAQVRALASALGWVNHGQSRLIGIQKNAQFAAQGADVRSIHGEVPADLALNLQRIVHSVGSLARGVPGIEAHDSTSSPYSKRGIRLH